MSNRILKINAEIQKYLVEIIQQELQNPYITGLISVVKVDTSLDLSVSKIYLSILPTADGNKEETFNQILHSAGYIRKELAERITFHKVPYLEFKLDTTNEYGSHIDDLLEKINSENKND